MDTDFIKGQIEIVHDRINTIKNENNISYPVNVCVASKYATAAEIRYIYSQGLRIFGENRVQDALIKHKELQDLDIDWQFIGHLQTNKLNKIIPTFNCVQSLDRMELIEQLNKKCSAQNITKNVLLQFNSGNDPDKFGFKLDDVDELCDKFHIFSHLRLQGVMLIAPLMDNESELGKIFEKTKNTYDTFSKNYDTLSVLSMGMSQDYQLAIKCGSNMVRIGRFIFKKQ